MVRAQRHERGTSPSTAALPDTPQLRLDPGMHTARIKRIDVDAEGRYLVSASDDKTVRVWSAAATQRQ